jgi:hypothetical protein
MRNGHIEGVALIDNVKDDNSAIKRGAELFLSRLSRNYDGFEIWERDRMIYRYPDVEGQSGGSASGSKTSSTGTPRDNGKKNAPRFIPNYTGTRGHVSDWVSGKQITC